MKYLIIVLSFFLSITCYPQAFYNRTLGTTTPNDPFLSSSRAFYMPRLTDTTLNGGLDSIGALMYDRLRAKIAIRDTVLTGGHKWTFLLKQGDVASVLANNGLSKSGDTIQLGQIVSAIGNPANLNINREIPLNGFSLSLTGSGSFSVGAIGGSNPKINSVATGGFTAIGATAVNGTGINVSTTGNGTALFAQTSGTPAAAVVGSNVGTSGYGVQAVSSLDAAHPFLANVFNTNNTSSAPVAAEFRRNAQGGGIGDGIGMTLLFDGQTTSTTNVESGQIRNGFSTVSHSSRSSFFEFWLVNNTVSARKALLSSTGQWTWDGYTSITQKTDTSAIKPIGYNTSTGLVEPMANWVGNVPSWNNVMAVGNTTTNKIGFMDANNGIQLTFRLRNLDTTNDQSIAALDACARRGKAVVRLIATAHKEAEVQFDSYSHPDSTNYVIGDTLKVWTIGTVSDLDAQRKMRKGLQITHVQANDSVAYPFDAINIDDTGRIGFRDVTAPNSWLHLPSQNGSIYPLCIMPNITPIHANSGKIYNTGSLLKYTDNAGVEWNMNNELGTAANGSYTAPTYTFASNSAFGMSYSSAAGSLVLSGSGTSNGAIAISNSNSSGQTGWDLRDHNFSQRAVCWLNNANSRLRLAAGTGISLDFEAGGFNDNNPSVRITSSGNMLIGTTTETGGYKLKNNGGFYQDGAFRLQPIIDPPGSYKILVRSLTSDSTVYGVASSTFSTPTSTATQIHDSLTANNISYGTYTPTLTNSSNIDASTAYQCQWMRVGNVVTVSGKIDIDPTSATTLTILGISLPITSAIGNDFEAGGTAAAAIPNNSGAIKADATNDRAQLDFTSGTDVANRSWFFSFTYLITPA